MSRRLIAGLVSMLPVVAAAQALPVEDFARLDEVYEVALAPDGRHVAMSVPAANGDETQLLIVALDGSGKTQALSFGKRQHVTDVVWTSPDRIVVSRARMEPMKAQPVSQGELVSADITGKKQQILFAYIEDDGVVGGRRKDEGFAWIVKLLDSEPGMAVVNYTAWWSPHDEAMPTTLYRVNTATGERRQVEFSPQAADFDFDGKGRARLRVIGDPEIYKPYLAYRPKPDDKEWTPVPPTLAGFSMHLLHVDADDDTAYALISDKREPAQLYRVSLSAGTRTKLAGRDDIDISAELPGGSNGGPFAAVMRAGHDGAPFAVVYNTPSPSVQYLDTTSEWARLHAGLMKAFPGQLVWMTQFSQDNSKVLFQTGSDRTPGGYYVFDRKTSQIQLINEMQPWIQAGRMAQTRPITFASRDGLTLHGLYTAPPGSQGPQPLVVMPHGGPHGIFDAWEYNRDVQFLASRGYAVLQVNFRGSGNRGIDFVRSGYRQWGGKMMDDIADGVRWAIDQKLVDSSRICTYGGSFGGYASLMNPIRYPDLYRCAIGTAGIYDLPLMKKVGNIQAFEVGKDYLELALGSDPAELIANSPARNADKIKVPVMLIHGSVDRQVPMDQFDAMVAGFRNAGVKVDTMVVKGEGHGFYKPENRTEVYKRIEAFLNQNIGPGAGAASAGTAK
ncbi:prolyl oligopeptidase family serine peptidase [Lysobacter sp. GCM10012299]|uniref:alpha/beta hydrolase family protein n=1 Tax=Lysobacter sp. GCM10012299 TaxID=3317333 RepID=UPI0036121060